MLAKEINLLRFLSEIRLDQLVVPIYQRTYSWTQRECRQLWDDIVRTGSNDDINTHFFGSIVYVAERTSQVSNRSPSLIIDGQQRLATVSLLLAALAKKIPEGEEPVKRFSSSEIREYYLLNDRETGERKYKLVLTQTDKETLFAIVGDGPMPEESSYRIRENFSLFEKWIDEKQARDGLSTLCMGLGKLTIVDIALDRHHDNPQLIFESMNSTGMALTQADLIRNFVLMGQNQNDQNRLYKNYWRPMEKNFGQEAYRDYFDDFMRCYLTGRIGRIPPKPKIYEEFKGYAHRSEIKDRGVDSLLEEVRTFAGYYCKMRVEGKETEPALASAFADLRELKVNVAYPLLLELYHDYASGKLELLEFVQAVRLVESYVFRRAVCDIPTNSLNNTFAGFSKAIDKNNYLESFKAHLLLLTSYRRFPDNKEFGRELARRNLYKFLRANYWLRRLENHGRKEPVLVEEYTIEHIMPQDKNLSTEWRKSLGDEWEQVHEEWLHTLGNLTLTGYNSELSNRSFVEKRDMPGGFSDSPMRLNEGLRDIEIWNKDEIRNRAARLAKKAVETWAFPQLPQEVLDAHRSSPEGKKADYTIADHPFLAQGGLARSLFDSFSPQVRALDPCVAQEFLKQYVAYKAETNFVTAIAQANGLKLCLSIDFDNLHDPRGMGRDVTNVGHLGTGNVEVLLDSEEKIPYAMGLVRQAFEQQMDNGEGM